MYQIGVPHAGKIWYIEVVQMRRMERSLEGTRICLNLRESVPVSVPAKMAIFINSGTEEKVV